MKIVKVIEHPDEVSGIFVFDDGTQMYWTEGRGSTVVLEYADGTTKETDSGDTTDPHSVFAASWGGPDDDCDAEQMDAGDVEDFRIKMGWD